MDVAGIAGFDKQVVSLQSALRRVAMQKASQASAPAAEIHLSREATEILDSFMKGTASTVSIQYDRDLNRVIIQVLDGKTQTLVKQYPPDDFLAFLRQFRQYLSVVAGGRV